MTTKSETSKVIDKAFGAALLLTGSTEVAENSVLDGIAALEFGHIVDDGLLIETVRAAIQRRVDFLGQSEQATSLLSFDGCFCLPGFSRLFCIATSPCNTSCDLHRGSTSHDPRDRRRAARRLATAAASRSLQLDSPRNYPLLATLLRLKDALIQRSLR